MLMYVVIEIGAGPVRAFASQKEAETYISKHSDEPLTLHIVDISPATI